MSDLTRLRRSRREILGHIAAIEEMRRGSVVRQFFMSTPKGKARPRRQGPYALYTCKKRGKTVGRRLRRPDEIHRLKKQVHNYHVFRDLCSELVEVAERICEEKEKARCGKVTPDLTGGGD